MRCLVSVEARKDLSYQDSRFGREGGVAGSQATLRMPNLTPDPNVGWNPGPSYSRKLQVLSLLRPPMMSPYVEVTLQQAP